MELGARVASSAAVLALLALAPSAPARAAAEEAATARDEAEASKGWEGRASAAWYFLPNDSDFLLPTVAADVRSLHLEARYNYEDRRTASIFAGWNLSFGQELKLDLVPMVGGAFGQSSGLIPAVELSLGWGPLAYYLEAEVVIDFAGSGWFYAWSELSAWPTDWIRGGLALQRTRVHHTDREVSPGLLVGVAVWQLEATFYLFNPFSSGDRYGVASVGVRF